MPVILQADAVDVAGGAGAAGNDGLLLTSQRIKQARFTDIWPTDKGDFESFAGFGLLFGGNVLSDFAKDVGDTRVMFGGGANDRLDAEAQEFAIR